MIETQRIMCCKNLASDEPSSWKTILLQDLKPVGGEIILGCSFDVKMLPIKLPPFYEDCLKASQNVQWQLIKAKNLLMI